MKKLLAIVVSLTMVCAIFTGCKDDSSSSTKSKKISFNASTAKYDDMIETMNEIKDKAVLTTATLNFSFVIPEEEILATDEISQIEEIFGDIFSNNKLNIIVDLSLYTFGENNSTITAKIGNLELNDFMICVDGVTYINIKDVYNIASKLAFMDNQFVTYPEWTFDGEYIEYETLMNYSTTEEEEYLDEDIVYTTAYPFDYDYLDSTAEPTTEPTAEPTAEPMEDIYSMFSGIDMNEIMQSMSAFIGNSQESILPDYMVSIYNAIYGDILDEAVEMFEQPLTETDALYAEDGYYMLKITDENCVTVMKSLVESLKNESPAVAKKAITAISSVSGLPAEISTMLQYMDDATIDVSINNMFAEFDDAYWTSMQSEMEDVDFEASFGFKLGGSVGDETINVIYGFSGNIENQEFDFSGEAKMELVDEKTLEVPSNLITEEQLKIIDDSIIYVVE